MDGPPKTKGFRAHPAHSTHIQIHISADRSVVSKALLDRKSRSRWEVHEGLMALIQKIEGELDTFRINFFSDDPEKLEVATSTLSLTSPGHGTNLVVTHEKLPPNLSMGENEANWRKALVKFARFVEDEQ